MLLNLNFTKKITDITQNFEFTSSLNNQTEFLYEQFANLPNAQYNEMDRCYYKYWNIKHRFPQKLFKKIKFSLKLKWPLLTQICDEISLISELNITKIKLKKKGFFLNWWGRVKKIKNLFTFSLNFELYFFYKLKIFYKSFFFLKKRKSIEKKLYLKNLINFYFFQSKCKIYIAICALNYNLFSKKNKKFSRSLPRTKRVLYLTLSKHLHWSFNQNHLNYSIDFNFFFLLKKIFNTLKIDYMFLTQSHKFSFLNFLKTKQPSQFLLIGFLFFFFFENTTSNFLIENFLSILMKIFFDLTNFGESINNIIYIDLNYIYIENLNWNWKKFRILLRSKERFVRSYLYNKKFKIKCFFWFYKIKTHLKFTLNTLFFEFSLQILFYSKIITNFFFKSKLVLYNKNYLFKLNFLSNKINNFFSIKNIVSKNFFFLNLKKEIFFSNLWIKLLYFLIWSLPNYYFNNKNIINFTLSTTFNYCLFFNKYLKLDSFSHFKTYLLLYTPNIFNSTFFFKKMYHYIFFNVFWSFYNLMSFEVFFFKKKLFFWWNLYFVRNFQVSFLNINWINLMFDLNLIEKFNNNFKSTFWFNQKLFSEELTHLSYEFIHTDLEWVKEFIWVKQLSELRLTKLTNFLKYMWHINVDPGNIQYSPDFTQQHEFALTLKWGLELEIMKKTWFIIEKWFYGTNKKIINSNFIRKKINFLYNIKKPKFKQLKTWFINWQHLLLSISNVYELTRLNLSTILACYWNIYKNKCYQLNNFYSFIPRKKNEFKKKNIYTFLTLAYKRQFIITCYKDYYFKTQIKKKISFPKMLKKKVFNKFLLSINFFFEIENFWNSFNFFLFKFFRKTKKRIKRFFKNQDFYNLIHLLIFKFYPSTSLPTYKTLNDLQLYYANQQEIKLFLPLKYTFITKQYFFKNIFHTNEFSMNFLLDFKNLELNSLKNILYFKTILNQKFKIVSQKKSIYFFNFKLKKFLQNSYLCKILLNLENIFKNFLTEFFYEKFISFFNSIELNSNFFKKNTSKFVCSKLYGTLTTTAFSISFFSFLKKKSFNTKFYSNNKILFYFFIDFELFILEEKILNLFYKNLISFLLNKETLQLLNNSSILNIKIYELNLHFLSILNLIIVNFTLKTEYWKKFIKSFYYWLINFFRKQNSNLFLKKIFFDTIWLIQFSNCLESLFLNFLIKLFFFVLKK